MVKKTPTPQTDCGDGFADNVAMTPKNLSFWTSDFRSQESLSDLSAHLRLEWQPEMPRNKRLRSYGIDAILRGMSIETAMILLSGEDYH